MWDQKLVGSIAASCLIDDSQSKIYLGTIKGNCYCLDEYTGSIIWVYISSEPIFGTPCTVFNGNGVVFPTVCNSLKCLSQTTGKLHWDYKTDGSIFSSIISYEDNFIFGCHDKNVYIVKATIESCDLVEKVTVESEITSTIFVDTKENIAIAACNSGVIYVIDLKCLKTVKQFSLPAEVFSSPVVYQKILYIGCRDNNLYSINISKYILNVS